MGFSSLFRKSSDKDKPDNSNPYAQQNDPTRYDNSQSFAQNSHTYAAAPTASRVGLPSSVRPGGHPNQLSREGSSQSSTFGGAKQTPPPSYSSQFGNSSLSSDAAPPSTGPGYRRDKLGASDGFGTSRYDSSARSQSSQFSQRPGQSQGGYGGLDNDDGGLFANYTAPPKYTAQPNLPGPGVPVDAQGRPLNWNEMTEEERDEAQVAMTKQMIEQETEQSVNLSRNLKNIARMAEDLSGGMDTQLQQDGERLNNAENRVRDAGKEAEKGDVNLKDLKAARKMWGFVDNSKSSIEARNQKKMTIQEQREMEAAQQRQEAFEREQALTAKIQELQANKPLLGKKDKNTARFQFEDESGRQREMNEEIEDNLAEVQASISKVNIYAHSISMRLDQQNAQIDRMQEKTERAADRVKRNQVHLDTFNRR